MTLIRGRVGLKASCKEDEMGNMGAMKCLPLGVSVLLLLLNAMVATAWAQEAIDVSPFAQNIGLSMPIPPDGPPGGGAYVDLSPQEVMAQMRTKNVRWLYDLGVAWSRLHPANYAAFGWDKIDPEREGKDFKFEVQDMLVRLAQDYGLRFMAVLTPVGADWPSVTSYIPSNREAYAECIRATIERYDGDGVDDMPGLKVPVRYWQLENEPDLHFRHLPDLTPEHYFEVLKITHKALKEASGDAQLILGPMAGTAQVPQSFEYLEQLVNLGALNYCDLVSYHIYPRDPSMHDQVQYLEDVRRLVGPKTRLWITETAVGSVFKEGEINDHPGTSETTQAEDAIKLNVFPVAHGVEKVFWVRIMDVPLESGRRETQTGAWDKGLITAPPEQRQKLAYYTYRMMTEKLNSCSWDGTKIIADGEDHIFAYKMPRKSGLPIWCVWWDYPAEPAFEKEKSKSFSLDFPHKTAVVTSAVTDANGKRKFEVMSAKEGKVVLTLQTSPLLVEVLEQ